MGVEHDLDMAYRTAEGDRRQGAGIRLGRVTKVDTTNGLIRVAFGDGHFETAQASGDTHPGNETDWIPWYTGQAGSMKIWHAPVVGEQVSVIGPSGEPSQGLAMVGLWSLDNPAPSTNADETVMAWDDGAQMAYDRGTHQMTVTVPDGGKVDITALVG